MFLVERSLVGFVRARSRDAATEMRLVAANVNSLKFFRFGRLIAVQFSQSALTRRCYGKVDVT